MAVTCVCARVRDGTSFVSVYLMQNTVKYRGGKAYGNQVL